MARAAAGCVNVVTIGDSMTVGVAAAGNYGWAYLVRDWLQSHGQASATLANYGIGGTMAPAGISLLAPVSDRFPSIQLLTLAYGLNDVNPGSGVDVPAYQAALTTLVQTLKPRTAHLLVFTVYPTTKVGAAAYSQGARAVATSEGVTVLDVSTLYDASNPTYSTDGTHATDLGHGLIRDALASLLGQIADWRVSASGRAAASGRATATGRGIV